MRDSDFLFWKKVQKTILAIHFFRQRMLESDSEMSRNSNRRVFIEHYMDLKRLIRERKTEKARNV